ncbi:U-box domain-containing protein 35-like [Actinidia eriantha]|uniref:U-box domain-containing protein 35-like n=1 Tax=Actinidia eriantha TaxID=165200 RepID=UPI002590F551|nr:U-box domain-containing protein 35-like [Actinidia eriantha]XP_057482591.1 U-box domain-containing protein 35-like [Actinidia eriantha]XP_057482599.1 U-box domain-containing protein 35-like [Actinidia eriantha]
MEESEIIEVGGLLGLPPPPSLTVAIAINGNQKSKYVVRWALEKFIPEGKIMYKLLHVRPKITTVPTPMGNSIPISQVRDDVATAYRKEVEWQATEKLLPYKKMCTQKKVQVEILQIESDDVVYAISREVAKSTINKLVIGASSRGMFSRGKNLSSKISECTPKFCTVYAVSKGKLSSLRPSDSETNGSIKDDSSETSFSTNDSSSYNSSSQAESIDHGSIASYAHFRSPSLPMQRFEALATINQTFLHKNTNSCEKTLHSRLSSLDFEEQEDGISSSASNLDIGRPSSGLTSCRSLVTDNQSWLSDQASTSDGPSDFSSESQINVNFELEKLRVELRHIQGMYAMAQSEAIDASRKVNDLQKRRLEEASKLTEINLKEVEAKELAIQEKVKYEAAKREVDHVKDCAERETAQKKTAEIMALHEANEKEKLENALVGPLQQYRKFEWEDIVSATSSFSDNLRIGMGAYGTVYKCSLHHTTAAVKVLHSKETHRKKQFQQELDILSNIRHPHLLILLGACPDHGCLVYEYMENGSLEDRLLRKNNTPSIPWFERCRIAWEIASAIVFLHNSKPQPIIHRDLKPANILLDHNLVSKIGDVGLSKMLQSDSSALTSMCKDTGPVGTLCYIDPEYQRTGLISPKSDVYAFGMVILQLLTAKPAIALAHVVEMAVDDGRLADVLDPEAGQWPIEETKELAVLGLKCAELRRRDRPDLKDQVLPALERLKEFADRARDMAPNAQPPPPNHFICPILKDIMEDPCVAADGYTYDRKAIEIWLEEDDKSPMTNLPLPNKNLIPNYTLLSAIIEWKSGKQ